MGPNRVSGLGPERFTDLKARTHGSAIKRPLPVGSRAWPSPADPFRRPYEMPGDRALLQRKLVSWSLQETDSTSRLHPKCRHYSSPLPLRINHQASLQLQMLPSAQQCLLPCLFVMSNKRRPGSCITLTLGWPTRAAGFVSLLHGTLCLIMLSVLCYTLCLGHLLVIVKLFLHLPARLLVQSVLYESWHAANTKRFAVSACFQLHLLFLFYIVLWCRLDCWQQTDT